MSTRPIIALLALSLVTACGGGGGGTGSGPNPPTGGPPGGGSGTASFVIQVPADTTVSIARRPKYVSPSTQSISISVNGTSTVQNLTPSSPGCSPAAGTTPLTCTISVPVPSGNQTFTLTTFDQQNGVGNPLSAVTTSAQIAAGQNNQIPVILNGIAATLYLSLSDASPPAGSPSTITLTVAAKDAAGNLIVSPGAFSSPITLQDSDSSGATSLSSTTLTDPSATITVAYNGQPIPGGSATFSASSASAQTAQNAVLTPSSTAPSPTPTPLKLYGGSVFGQDPAFNPEDGDTPSGGTGSNTVDGIACDTAPIYYHVHAHLSIFVNGNRLAVPDAIGMYKVLFEKNNQIINATCFYHMHTHDAAGIIHMEAPKPTSYTLGNLFDIWGMPLSATNLAGHAGKLIVFTATAPPGIGGQSGTFTQFTGDPKALIMNSHEEVVLEVGPAYVMPPSIPSVIFETSQ